MTFDQFVGELELVHAKALETDPHHRRGQSFYNHLSAVNKPLATKILGTRNDPFYLDEVPSFVYAFCSENWDWVND